MNINPNVIAHWRACQSSTILDNKTGTIVSWTKVYSAPEPFDIQTPYFLALIAVDRTNKILCPVIVTDETKIVIGAHVQFVTRITHSPSTNCIINYSTKAMII